MLALLVAFGVIAFAPASFRAAAPSPNRPETAERRIQPEPGVVRVGVAKPGGGYAVGEMPIEAYVARVLAGEAVRDSQPAALEALAITIRTFAVANRGRHRADGFDLCDQTHCQVLRAPTAAAERAANATAGRLLLRDGAAAAVYYSASCGGHTAMPSEVWPGHENPPYLPSKRDDACEGAPEWTTELHEADLQRALRASGFVGGLRDLRVVARTASGRVAQLRLDGVTPPEISGQDLRVAVGRTLGWQHIKSAAFDVRRNGAAYRFTGRGSGHGVGLCVIGSAKLAERGIAADAILARYFPGLTISGKTALSRSSAPPGVGNHSQVEDTGSIPDPKRGEPIPDPRARAPIPDPKRAPSIPDPRATPPIPDPKRGAPIPDPRIAVIAISLPDDDEGERAAIERQALRARDSLARALAVPAPPRVTLRFHPTTDAYEQATGRAWFTSATLRNGEIHLLPPATLRDRGVLERTIRHELVHLMTDGVLGARPQWVREGAAIYFAGEPPIAGEPQQRPAFQPPAKPACPADAELLRPVSVGALANAYARARACFARQVQSGKSWREVK